MAATTATSPLLAGIDRAIELAEAEARAIQEGAPAGQMRGGGPAAAPAPAAEAAGASAQAQTHTLEDLTVFIARLKQMKEWLQQDERLLPVVDSYIGQKVQAMEKRTNAANIQLAVITTIGGALLGWLISALQSPSAILHAIGL
jgi:hypothetical protein